MRHRLLGGLLALATVLAFLAAPAEAVAAGSPTGHLDSVKLVGGTLVLSGWSFDRDHLSAETVDVYQTTPSRTFRGHAATTLARTDIDRTFHLTGDHGWTLTVAAHAGAQTWCAYGINIGPGANTLLGCRALTVPAAHEPTGAVGAAVDDGILTQLTGWAFDRDDLTHPESIDIYQVSPTRTFIRRLYTTMPRPDVNAKYKVTGQHGWTTQLPDPAGRSARYCAYALNVGVVAANPQIGCVDLGAGPAAGTISASSVDMAPTSAAISVAVAPRSGYPMLRITRSLSDATSGDWTAPVVAEVPISSSRYVSFTDAGLVPGVSYRYTFFLHDANGNHTTGYPVDVATDDAACAASVCAWGGTGLGAGPAQPSFARTPVAVAGLTDVTKVVAGQAGGAALRSDGRVWTWGATQSVPTELAGLSDVVDLAQTDSTGYAVKADGTLWLWGLDYLQLTANGQPSYVQTPFQVPGVSGLVSLSAGDSSVYGLAADHTVWAIGNYADFQLGAALNAQPVQHIVGLTGVVALAGADNAGFAVRADGTVWSWGSNTGGLLGNGSTQPAQAAPTQIPGLTGVTQIAASGTHALALKSDGSVLAWGSDYAGQLGDGRSGLGVHSSTPVAMPKLTGVVGLAAGSSTSYLVRSDGSVWSFGDNTHGQLGNGGDALGHGPAVVLGLSHVTQVAANGSLVFALSH